MSKNANYKPIFVEFDDLDFSRIGVDDPIRETWRGKDGKERGQTTSKGYYLDDNGEKRELFFTLPEQSGFIGVNHTYGIREDEKCMETIKGLQVSYPLTSMKTVDNPTESEERTKELFDTFHRITWESLVKICSSKGGRSKVPSASYNSYLGAKEDEDPEKAIKKLYSRPNIKGTKTPDLKKPESSYIKILTKGEGRDMKCLASIFGPGDKQDKTGLKYASGKPVNDSAIPGIMLLCVRWDGLWWGGNPTTSHGVSIRLKVVNINFTPNKSDQPAKRWLPANNAPVEECDEDDVQTVFPEEGEKDEEGGEDEGFEDGSDYNHFDVVADDDEEAPPPKPKKKTSKAPPPEEDEPPKKLSAKEKRLAALKKKRAAKNK